MRKNIFKAALAAAMAATMILACNKTQEPESVPEQGKVTIKAVIPEVMPLKVSGAAAEKGVSWSWEAGDKLTVIGSTTEVYTIKPGFTAREAEFEGNPVSGSTFTILYPGTCTSLSEAEALDWTSQKQTGNGSAAHLRYVAALTGVDAYEEFSFDPDWATEHGGALKQSGVIKFVLTLPEGITGVTRLGASTVTGEVAALTLENVTLGEDRVLTAYAGIPWMDIEAPAGLPVKISLTSSTDAVWSKEITLPEAATLMSGKVNNVKLNVAGWDCESRYAGGTGVESDPWLIATANHMVHMNEDLTKGETKYFKMIADVDMASVTDWAPSNVEDKTEEYPHAFDRAIFFDGDNHTIKNLKMTGAEGVRYISLFGILNGTVKNLKLESCSITSDQSSPLGLIAGWAGVNDGSVKATVTNVHAKNCTVTSQYATNDVGGLVGRSNETTFTDCSFDGTIVRTVKGTGYRHMGGIVGGLPATSGTVTFTRCNTSGSMTDPDDSMGGILGGMNAAFSTELTDCHSTMTITGEGKVIGGICGYVGGIKCTDCSYDGTITATLSGDAYVGGIIPYTFHWAELYNCTSAGEIKATKGNRVGGIFGSLAAQADDTHDFIIDNCHSTMTISGATYTGGILGLANSNTNGGSRTITGCSYKGTLTGGATSGGLVGYAYKASISKCAVSGTISSTTGSMTGGMIGRADNNAVIEDCSFSGSFTSNGQRAGGIVGNVVGGNVIIRRCFTDATILDKNFNTGGIVGMGQSANSVAGTHENLNITLEKCIAWCPSVKSETGTGAQWGSGAIVGCIGGKNTLTDCIRRPDMVLSYTCANTEWPLLYDQENASASAQLKYYNGAAEAPATCQSPYHGKAAAAGKTAAQVAADLGWPTVTWDLSGSIPVLK